MGAKHTLVVIGNGMVGQHFLTKLVHSGISQNFRIVVFCAESRPAYDRTHLSECFVDKTTDDLALAEADFYKRHNITLYLGDKAVKIYRRSKIIISEQGLTLRYDKLVLAMGSYPFVPPIAGHGRTQCLVYRTVDDWNAIKAAAKNSAVGVVLGGGLLGLEAAKALTSLGLQTYIVELSPRLMPTQLDDTGSAMLRQQVEALGITVLTGKNTHLISQGQQCLHKLCFADGNELETDMVVFAAGIRPQDEIARDCSLDVGARGGIVINNQCKTSDPNIYAIGECALWGGAIFGLASPGYAMAQTVVADLAGQPSQFLGAKMSTHLKLPHINVVSMGDVHAKTPGAVVYSYQNGANGVYRRLVVSANGKQLLGAVLVGDVSAYTRLLPYFADNLELPSEPDTLILPQRPTNSAGFDIYPLPRPSTTHLYYDLDNNAACLA